MKLPKSLPCESTESLLQAVFQHRPSGSSRHHGAGGDDTHLLINFVLVLQVLFSIK